MTRNNYWSHFCFTFWCIQLHVLLTKH